MRLHNIPMEDDVFREKLAEVGLLGLAATTPEQMERVHQPLEILFSMAFVAGRYDLIKEMMYVFEDLSLHAFRKNGRRSQWTLTDWGQDWDLLLRLSRDVLTKLEARKEIIPDLVTFVSSDPVYEACLFAFLNKTKDPMPRTVTEVHQHVVQANGGTLTVTRERLARKYIKDLTNRRIIEKTSYYRSKQGRLYQMTTFGQEVACILEDRHHNQAVERIDGLCGLFNFVTLFHSPTEIGSDYVDRTKFEEKLRASHPDDPRFSTSTTVEDLLSAGLYLGIIATAPDDKNAYTLRPIWKNQILPKMMNAADERRRNEAIEKIDGLCGLFNFVTLFHSPTEIGSDYVNRTEFEERLRANHPDDPRFSTSTTVEDLLSAGLYLGIIATAPDDQNAYTLTPIWKNQILPKVMAAIATAPDDKNSYMLRPQILPKMMNAADERGVSAAPPPPPEPSR